MRKSKCLAKWRAGQPVLGLTLHYNDASIFEMVSMLHFDVIWMDLEHQTRSVETATEMIRAARSGDADILARPAKGEFVRMARLLEAGANGIMYPRCDSVEEAMEVVVQAKFPPVGKRGLDGAGPDSGYMATPLGKYIQHANEETFLVIQIESREALAVADQIATVEGVDLLFFGPGDYSLQQGFPGKFDDPRYLEAVKAVANAAVAAGKWWGTPAFSIEHAEQLLGLGANFVTYGSDLTLLRKVLIDLQKDFGTLGFFTDANDEQS